MTIEEAEKQYNEYLEGHISNVQEALEVLNELDIQFVKDNYDELKTICQNHDASKYSEEEYIPYREHFYPINDEEKLKTEAFEQACRHHIKNNKHHWDYWLNDDNELDIPDEQEYKLYCVERCCDWLSMACQHDEPSSQWYNANKEYITMPDYGWELCDEIMSKVPEKCDLSFKGTRGELDESNFLNKLQPKIENDDSDRQSVAYYKNKILKGEHRPILVNSDNEVIDGNHTMVAYQELGIEPENVYLGTSEDFLKAASDLCKDGHYNNLGLDAVNKMINDGTAKLLESLNSDLTKGIGRDVANRFGWHLENGSKKSEFLIVTNKNNKQIGKLYFTYPSSISLYIFGKKQVISVPNDYDRSDYSYEQFIDSCEQVIKGMINKEKQTKSDEKDKAKGPEQLQLDLFESMSQHDKKETMIKLVRDADKEGIDGIIYWLKQLNFIPDDRNNDKKFILSVIENNYDMNPKNKSVERDNFNIENAICNGLHKDSEEYLDHEPFKLDEEYKIIKGDKGYLIEASMKQLKRKTLSEDPTRAKKSKHVQSKYIGISKYGVLNFETTSETYSGVTWYQEVHFPSFTGFMNIVEQGDEIEAEDVKKAMSSDNIKISCDDPSFLYWAWKYMAWKDVYGLEKETRAPKRNNTRLRGGLCKHLYSVIELLGEKRIIDLVTRDLNQFCKMKLGITDHEGYQDAEGMMKKDFKANQYDYNIEDIMKTLLSKENYQKYMDGTPLEDLGLSDKEMADIDKAIKGMRSAGQYALKSELEKQFEPVKRGRKITRADIKLKVGNDEEEEGK